MAIYEYPTNITNINDLFVYVNTITSGWAMTIFIFVIFCVAFFSLKVYSTARAFAGASFITLIATIFSRILGLVSDRILIASIVLVVVAMIWLFVENKVEY